MYKEIYENMKAKVTPTSAWDKTYPEGSTAVVPYEGGAMKAKTSERDFVNSMYKKAAQELGVTDKWWLDQRVADRAYELIKEAKQEALKSNQSPNSTGVLPGNVQNGVYTQYGPQNQSPNSTAILPGMVQEGRYTPYGTMNQSDNSSGIRPGGYNKELDIYQEYQRPATYRLSDMYEAKKAAPVLADNSNWDRRLQINKRMASQY